MLFTINSPPVSARLVPRKTIGGLTLFERQNQPPFSGKPKYAVGDQSNPERFEFGKYSRAVRFMREKRDADPLCRVVREQIAD